MKFFIILAFTAFLSLGNAQTPLISHKSHAGTSGSYLIASSSNFGVRRIDYEKQIEQPKDITYERKPYKVENFKPLNDSIMILEVTDLNQQLIEVDTLSNKKRLSTMMFHYVYADSVKKAENLEIYKQEIEKQEQLEKRQLESQQQLNQEATPAKKKKKSYLLFLFGITGGGMLLMKLLARSKHIHSSIA
ncbi:MAG: hypothetical protein K0S23_206 [Fluviicola sp.]|uniref:hypothetical protein n=1 Tax=Fluviicola sp. TaxID=1917219 RepID=UPI0026098FE2|nr:hypothetical protein [Fluviicola sp.]MDF3025899.1 hypothetical protein [Fluviicola sp.]